jgi:hypothetical protein
MRHTFKLTAVLATSIALLGATAARSEAGFALVTSSAALSPNDNINWAVLGPNFSAVPNPFAINSTGGVATNVSQVAFPFQRRDQGGGWAGNFGNGEALLWTGGTGNGPITIDFANTSTVTGAGAQIQSDFFGPFTAVVEALDASGTVLATFNLSGNSTANGDDSAIFIGILATGGDSFDKFRIGVPNTLGPQDFAIGQLELKVGADINPIPAPPAGILFAIGAVGLAGGRALRRRLSPVVA